jgi:UDP-galactopyranose mutase
MKYDFLIVGCGFSGAVLARELAEANKSVKIIDTRKHIGGNAFDIKDKNGILIHPYGPHIFHTNSDKIFAYLSKYTKWRFYEHRVLARNKSKHYQIPINLNTINSFFNLSLNEKQVESFFEKIRIKKNKIKTSEDVVLNSVGEELCDAFFRGYTKKQWDLDLSELSAGVASRIPTRTNKDDRYFSDKYQFMPKKGYSDLFKNLLNHSSISIDLGVDFFESRDKYSYKNLIYTGPIDKFYNFKYGKLPYRSLIFKHEFYKKPSYQKAATINFPNEYKFTRITEFKKITGQKHEPTSIVREYSRSSGDPYYPVPNKKNESLFKKYQQLAKKEKNTYFVGRLAEYRYYNMDQVVGAALTLARKLC